MAGRHADPRLARLMATDRTPAPAAAPARIVVAKQADGHGAVRIRSSPSSRSHAVIPDGSQLRVLAEQGEWLRVSWRGEAGYVKRRNTAPPQRAAAPTVVTAPPAPASAPPKLTSVCSVTVNGQAYVIDLSKDSSVTGLTSVHDWVDANVFGARLRRNCGIGFCGACLCMLSYKDPSSGQMVHRAFNSCLRPILSCNGMAITTAAGVGSEAKPHPIQKALADNSGTQCGYCSAAVVMNLYAHLQDSQGKEKQAKDLDSLLDCNTCRCTGYRPILDTYKSFATNPPAKPQHPGAQLRGGMAVPDPVPPPGEVPLPEPRMPPVYGALSAGAWHEPQTEADLQQVLAGLKAQSPAPKDVMLVCGRTSQGLYDTRVPDAFVNLGHVGSLRGCSSGDAGLEIGSGVTMHDAIEFLDAQATQNPAKGAAFARVAAHGRLSPGHTIRNVGTVGGNVMLSHRHSADGNQFPLEWPMLFTALSAKVTVVDSAGAASELDMDTFYQTDMSFKYLQKISVPWNPAGMVFRTFRDSQRHMYSHALIAAAMTCNLDSSGKVAVESSRVVFNNIGQRPLRLAAVEALLDGCDPTDEARFQSTLLPALQKAVVPSTPYGDKSFREGLAVSYLYKFMLALQPSVPADLQSAAQSWLPRAVTSASQTFQQDKSVWPLNKAMPKQDALKQVTGQAQYVRDLEWPRGCLHAALVMAEQCGDITSIDDSVASAMPGFERVVTSKDVPAAQNKQGIFVGYPILADGKAEWIGQMVAIVLADSPEHARECARAVVVNYQNVRAPVLTTDDAIAAGAYFPDAQLPKTALTQGDADKALAAADHVAKFTFHMGNQYHYHMETQSAMALPTESGITVHAATQVPSMAVQDVANCTGLSAADVDVQVRRCGGGFGGKLDGSRLTAQVAALPAWLTGRPVRFIADIEHNMRMYGQRAAWRFDSQVGVMKDGQITAVKTQCVINSGAAIMPLGVDFAPVAFFTAFDNVYNIQNWDVTLRAVRTDTAPTAACRAPGWLPGVFSMERVIQAASAIAGVSMDAVRTRNMYKLGDTTPFAFPLKNWNVPQLLSDVMTSSDYQKRLVDVQKFNAANRWVKKGIAALPTKFAIGGYTGAKLTCELALRISSDGSISYRCGGTEIGQGLTTKVSQTIAYHLGNGCEVSNVVPQPYSSVGGFGGAMDATGGSITSEMACLAAKNACMQLKPGLDKAAGALPADAPWGTICAQAATLGEVLSAHGYCDGMAKAQDPDGDGYNTCGTAVVEVTLDALTGQLDIARGDILYDIGRSVNPTIDVGQIEGAFAMCAGYVLTEEVSYDKSGMMEWKEYKPPTPWEIPAQWNVGLYNSAPNPATVGGGKAIGEPPMSLAYAIVDAAEQALAAVATAQGKSAKPIEAIPLTITQRHRLAQVTPDQLKFK
eukprot:TRINITY_DN398_c0_g1_i1.p2 TRINITY_DN398_c0_g1~~TRINITY_DN398_c0_g1_i1.p2  ORF type:complete len:1405 (+),score=494.19 TRINITY_DN398_c0_g1_i1:110-4324(+)